MPHAIKQSLGKSVDKSELAKLVQKIDQNSFEFNINKFAADFAYKFGYKGPVMEQDYLLSK